MTIETKIAYQPISASAEIRVIEASAVPISDRICSSASLIRGIRTLGNLLVGVCLIAAPLPAVQAEAHYIDEVIPMPCYSNFITADGKYILLADGKILSGKEE